MNKAETGEIVSSVSRRFLTFSVGPRTYALPAETVVEVIRIPHVARVPQAPRALLGIANLRGTILPLASLRALLGMDDATESTASRAIVLDGSAPVGIAVDAIGAVVPVESQSIQRQPAAVSAEPGERLAGAFKLGAGNGAAKIIDVQGLLAEAFAQRGRTQRHATPRVAAAARQESQAPVKRDTLITFDVAGQEFALDLSVVQEIVSAPENVAAMPHAEALVVGMMAFRRRLLPLLSLRGLLGFRPAPNSDTREKIIVASVGGALVGLIADRARAVVSADQGLMDPVPAVLAARIGGEARIKAIYRGDHGRRLISILAPEQLFREDVMQRLEQSTARSDSQSEGLGEERKFLVFRLGADEFGLPVEAVDEVARVPQQITRIPKTPKFLEGVINLRGNVLPVVDQRHRFDLPKLQHGDGRRLIVVRTERHRAGLIVDSVLEVLRTTTDRIEAPPNLTGDITRLVNGVVNLARDGRIVLLLDPAELLTRAERGLLDSFESKARATS